MGIVVACQRCGAQLRSKDEFAGRPVRCPYCHTVNQLPGTPNYMSSDEQRQFCPICRGQFKDDDESVKGPQGVLYHRVCFELERVRWRAHQSARFKSGAQGTTPPTPIPVAIPTPPEPLPTSPWSLPNAPTPQPPSPQLQPITPIPATPQEPQPQELAPLQWPAGLEELLDDWDAHSPRVSGLAAQSSGPMWSPRARRIARKLVVLTVSLLVPLLGLAVIIGVLYSSISSLHHSPAQPDAATGEIPASTTESPSPSQPAPYDPLASLGFRLDIPEGLRFAQRNGDTLSYTADGHPPKSWDDPLCLIGSIPANVSPADQKAFAERLLRQTDLPSDVRVRSSGPITVDGVDGWELEAATDGTPRGMTLLVYQLTLFHDGHCQFIQGSAGDRYKDTYLPKYRALGRSYRHR